MVQIYPGYCPAWRWWYLLRRTADMVRLGWRVTLELLAGRGRMNS